VWYLRGWQPVSDLACARLTEPASIELDLLSALDPKQLRQDTVALASIHPRHGGTSGEIAAREWVISRFQALGLQHVREEPVLYPRWIGEGARLTLLTSPTVELPCLALNGSASTPPEGTKAPLVDVGNGQAEDFAALSREETEGHVHLAWGGSLHRRDICLNARQAGAVGVIVAHPDPDPADHGSDGPHLLEAGTSVVLGRLPTFSVSHPTGLRLSRAAQQEIPVRINVSRRYDLGRGQNVVGEIPGETSEYVALVAHYDAWHNGAADNAAGVAGMLSLAAAYRRAAEEGLRPTRTLRFISTTSEEEGLMGALADVVLRGLQVKARCRGVISLDVVGAPGGTLWATGWPPQLCGSAAAIARGLGYEGATGNNVDCYQGRIYGDHWPYTLLRIPGVMLAKYPYRYYHTPYDTPDRLDYQDARYHTAVAGTLAWRLAALQV
jgi:hypothetical protein